MAHRGKTAKSEKTFAGAKKDRRAILRREADVFINELRAHHLKLKLQNDELLKAQRELREACNKFADLFDFSPAGYLALSEDGIIVEANLTAGDLLGVDRRLLIGQRLTVFADPDALEGLLPIHMHDPSSPSKSKICEAKVTRGDGSSFYARIECVYVGESKNGSSCLAAVSDIDDQKSYQDTVKKSNEEWRLTFDSITDFVSVIDADMKIAKANKALAAFFNLESKDLIGKHCHDLFPASKKPFEFCPFEQMLEKRAAVTQEVEDPAIGRPMLVSLSPIFDEEGKIVGAVHIAKDISEMKRMEAEVLRAKNLQSLGLLAGGLAHDFNNLLMSILGNVNLASLFIDNKEETQALLASAENSCMQAHELTKQLLTFSKGGAPITGKCRLNDLVAELCEFVQSCSNMECECAVSDDLLPVNIDRDQILRVLQNLILNSVEAMPDGGKINIHCENAKRTALGEKSQLVGENWVKVRVSDNGPGIHKNTLPKIFDPYFTTKKFGAKKGVGLGLTVSHSIIEQHGGKISVHSEEGKGTAFDVFLPATPDFELPAASGVETGASTVKRRILVMEDEDYVTEVIARMLSKLGYEAAFASGGEEAVALYSDALKEGAKYDAVILDLTIKGGMGGRETVKKILDLDSDAVAIVSSGYADDPILSDFADYGFKSSIPKPYTLGSIANVLASLLGGKS